MGLQLEPVAPGANSEIDRFPIPAHCKASLEAAVYADGTFEGSPAAISELLYWRLATISEVEYWIPKLKAISGTRENVIALISELGLRRDYIQAQSKVEARHGDSKVGPKVVAPDARLLIVDLLDQNCNTVLNWLPDLPHDLDLPGLPATEIKYLAYLKASINSAPSEAALVKTFIPAESGRP